jgi:hypothetical protein
MICASTYQFTLAISQHSTGSMIPIKGTIGIQFQVVSMIPSHWHPLHLIFLHVEFERRVAVEEELHKA